MHFKKQSSAGPNFRSWRNGFILIPILLLFAVNGYADEKSSGRTLGPDEIVGLFDDIAASEKTFKEVTARLSVRIPDKDLTWYTSDWAFSHGRESIRGILKTTDGDEVIAVQPYAFAFDGEKMMTYRQDDRAGYKGGAITPYDGTNFRGFPTFNTLMGADADPRSRGILSDALLRNGDNAEARKLPETNLGENIFEIRLFDVRAGGANGAPSRNVRVLIDADRGHRMLQLEVYQPTEWTDRIGYLTLRVSDIELKERGGLWIPVSGRFEAYTASPALKDGFTMADAEQAGPEGALAMFHPILRKVVPDRMIEIEIESVRTDYQQDSAAFRINYPLGTAVVDEFAGVGFELDSNPFGLDDLGGILERQDIPALDVRRSEATLDVSPDWFASINVDD